PNLREKAIRAARAWLGGARPPEEDARHQRALRIYGALAMTFSTVLLSVVYVNVYRLATSYFAFSGLVAFVLFSGLTLNRAAAEPASGVRALVRRAAGGRYLRLGIAAGLILLIAILPWELRVGA